MKVSLKTTFPLLLVLVDTITGFTSAWITKTQPSASRRNSWSGVAKLGATVEASGVPPPPSPLRDDTGVAEAVRQALAQAYPAGQAYAADFDFGPPEAAFYALFAALRQAAPLALKGQPFVLTAADVTQALGQSSDDGGAAVGWAGFFDMNDLEKALEDDFLDALRGSTDNRKGWKITDVSVPRGESFDEARMTFADVQAALEKGTVIFNAAGAHIPKLALPSLCCTDATALPAALNLYVTAPNKRTSAPPHTDKQDVVVIQSTGTKHWRVYSPPDPTRKPEVDIFARGKGDDALPLHMLSELGSELLLETTLQPGDVLFIPAAFPHTTSTVPVVEGNEDASHTAALATETSIHLTNNMDHYIWELDYLSVRRLALRRAGVADTALGNQEDGVNQHTGQCNNIVDKDLRKDLFSPLPLGFLEPDASETLVDHVASELQRISLAVDAQTAEAVPPAVWKETVLRVQQQGRELWETHRDMYLAAIEEGRTREAEDAMTAHLTERRVMTPERMQRLSLFRVKKYYDEINVSKEKLRDWSLEGAPVAAEAESSSGLPSDWAFTLPVKVGDQVEADLGGAFFPATVSRASGGTIDVQFFDGDRETNLQRSQIKLLVPPRAVSTVADVDTSKMTPKQLKRWKKQQKLNN